MDVSWDTHEVARLSHNLAGASTRVQARASLVIHKGALDIEADAKILAPVDTGFLRSSIGVDFDGPLAADIGPTAEYGVYVELGVPHPWIIRARDGGTLAFNVAGRLVFAKQVTHPPMPPQPYMGPAADRRLPGIEQALGQAGEEALL